MIINPYLVESGISYDPDAAAFFTAAGITDTTQKGAVNQLVLDLKGYSIWTKCLGLYPIVGGTASSHAVNLKSPGTFNITNFVTGWTHGSTGATPDGISAYGDTNILGTVDIIATNYSYSIYSRTNNVNTNIADIGTGGSAALQIRTGSNSGRVYGLVPPLSNPSFTNTDSFGFYTVNGKAGGGNLIKNGTTNKKTATVDSTINNTNIVFAKVPGFTAYSNREYAFVHVGTTLTNTEAANLYTAVQAYQTTLGRQV